MKVIYCILNKLNGKRYIGSTNNYYSRIKGHKSSLKAGKHKNIHLQRAWDKYGSSQFEFLILEKIEDSKDLILREQWWVDNTPSQYNICKIVVSSTLGVKKRPETLEKMRLANLGLKHPEWRNKIKSIAQGGKNHWQYGKKMPEEVKKKKSISIKKLYETGFHPRHKKILQLTLEEEYIREWNSIKEAAITLNFNADSISNNLRKRSKTAHGYKWKYKN